MCRVRVYAFLFVDPHSRVCVLLNLRVTVHEFPSRCRDFLPPQRHRLFGFCMNSAVTSADLFTFTEIPFNSFQFSLCLLQNSQRNLPFNQKSIKKVERKSPLHQKSLTIRYKFHNEKCNQWIFDMSLCASSINNCVCCFFFLSSLSGWTTIALTSVITINICCLVIFCVAQHTPRKRKKNFSFSFVHRFVHSFQLLSRTLEHTFGFALVVASISYGLNAEIYKRKSISG